MVASYEENYIILSICKYQLRRIHLIIYKSLLKCFADIISTNKITNETKLLKLGKTEFESIISEVSKLVKLIEHVQIDAVFVY